jgi:hypothetical protein
MAQANPVLPQIRMKAPTAAIVGLLLGAIDVDGDYD